MKKKIIYLYGGPGTGKSTTAADLFAITKKAGLNAELIREYVKDWVWEGRQIKPGDQVYIASKQSRKERICFDDVDIIISDSPMYLSQFYEEKYDATYHVCRHIIRKHEQIAKSAGFDLVHIFLRRVKPYTETGRYQTESQAKEIDQEIKQMLDEHNIYYHEVDADEDAATKIVDQLLTC